MLTALAEFSLSPVNIAMWVNPNFLRFETVSLASFLIGSSIHKTANNLLSNAINKSEYSSFNELIKSPWSGLIFILSSSKIKCSLPIKATFPSIVDFIPWAIIYSGFECISSWLRFFSLAFFTTALAIECGKCSSRQAAILSASSSSISKEITLLTSGSDFVKVPVLSKIMVSALAILSKYFPPFTSIFSSPAWLIAFIYAIGIVSFKAQE